MDLTKAEPSRLHGGCFFGIGILKELGTVECNYIHSTEYLRHHWDCSTGMCQVLTFNIHILLLTWHRLFCCEVASANRPSLDTMMMFLVALGKAPLGAIDPPLLILPLWLKSVYAPFQSHTGVGHASAKSL
jgi:hypothetical protein